MSRPIVVAVTGASGVCYAQRLLEVLLATSRDVLVSISPAGAAVLKEELGLTVDLDHFDVKSLGMNLSGPRTPGNLTYYHYLDLISPMASGSFLTAGMVICPCSGGTMSGIAHAASQNLIQRAADVHLKERRRLILVPRETPLSTIQIENMKRAADAGAVVLPAMPGFYHGAKTIRDLVDFIVARICDQLGVEHQLMKRWGSE